MTSPALVRRLTALVFGALLAVGWALMKRERFDAAIALLSPLANSPHGGALAVAAQRLIAQARGRRQAGPAGEDEPEDAQAPAPG